MIIRKIYISVIGISLALAIIVGGGHALHKEWRARYGILYNLPLPVNLFSYYLTGLLESATPPILASREEGLPKIRLYISDKAKNALMEDLPARIKDYQRATMIYPDGQMNRVRVRHRGDNPVNWAYVKKSWRVKARKKSLFEGNIRQLNYIVPQGDHMLENYLAN